MSIVTKDIVNLINKNAGDEFLDTISTLKLNDLINIDFSVIDKAIMNNGVFPCKLKLVYAKYYNRPIYRNLLEIVTSDMMKADYDALLFVARSEEFFRKEALNTLIIRTCDKSKADEFKFGLQASNLYDSFVLNLKNEPNSIVKIRFALKFEYLDEFYPDNKKLAEVIATCDFYKGLISGRTDDLIELSNLTKDKGTLEYIESILEDTIKKETEEFYIDTYKELGIKEAPKEKIDKQIKEKKFYCLRKIKNNK